MGRFLFTCTTLFALFVSLSFNLSAQQTLVMVRVNGMDFRLSDPPNGSDPAAHYGTQLKNVLHRLDPFSQCTVWAQHPIQLKVGSGVKTLQEGLVLHFENIELKPTRPFFHIFHLGGNGSTLIGLKVFGDGDNRRVAGDRSAGIGIYGRNCRVLQCTSSTMPDGGNANCFEVFGEYCNVSSCLGINPGYACFRTKAHNTKFDRIETFVDRSTANGQNRSLIVGGQDLDEDDAENGLVEITNSLFRAEFANGYEKLAPSRREVASVIDPGDLPEDGLERFVMRDCTFHYGETVTNTKCKHVFKVVDVHHTILERINVITHPGFGGWTMRIQEHVNSGTPVSVDILNCHWDSGLNFDGKLGTIRIRNSSIGSFYAYANELFEDTNFPTVLEIHNSKLRHPRAMCSFSRATPKENRLVITESTFGAMAPSAGKRTHLFRGSGLPIFPSYFTSFAFLIIEPPAAANRIHLSNSPKFRLAFTPNAPRNSFLFDPSGGVTTSETNPRSSDKVYGPPFNNMPGRQGDRIYLAGGADDNEHGWGKAAYWEWRRSNGRWNKVVIQ